MQPWQRGEGKGAAQAGLRAIFWCAHLLSSGRGVTGPCSEAHSSALGFKAASCPHLLPVHCPLAVFAQYLYDNFGTSLTAAGALASTFSLTNIFSRPAGGWLSDAAAHRLAATHMHMKPGLCSSDGVGASPHGAAALHPGYLPTC